MRHHLWFPNGLFHEASHEAHSQRTISFSSAKLALIIVLSSRTVVLQGHWNTEGVREVEWSRLHRYSSRLCHTGSSFAWLRRGHWYQDDGAPCHRTRIVNQWIEDNNMDRVNWPLQPLDLKTCDRTSGCAQMSPSSLSTRTGGSQRHKGHLAKHCCGKVSGAWKLVRHENSLDDDQQELTDDIGRK